MRITFAVVVGLAALLVPGTATAAPPANDDFARATVVSTPYSAFVDITEATIEANEPSLSCGYGSSPGTVWYAFTPSVSRTYVISSSWTTQVAVYTGSGLDSLSSIGCQVFGNQLALQATADVTYYVQLGAHPWYGGGTASLTVDVAPNPTANFSNSVWDPSTFDTVQFWDYSYDPVWIGIQSRHWSFGDGDTSTSQYPTHRYAADGDYEVTLEVTTWDGRSASTTQVVQVRTHDVSIVKFLTPQSANAGQTKTITVGISNRRYAESVRVDLYRSSANGFVQVGSLTQSAPSRPGGRTTDFRINHTFTSDDASLGKVTFRAVATIVNARDALPGDNDVVALPTKVNG